jgi:hypothetical protein
VPQKFRFGNAARKVVANAHLVAASARRVQRVLEPDVGGGQLVDHGRVEVLAPELGEPTPDDGLVLFGGHSCVFSSAVGGSPRVGASVGRRPR